MNVVAIINLHKLDDFQCDQIAWFWKIFNFLNLGKSRFSQKKFYNINYWLGDFWAILKKYILCKKAEAILWATSGNLGYLLFQHLVVQNNQLGQKYFIVLLRPWLPMTSSEFLEGRKCLVSIQKTSMSLRQRDGIYRVGILEHFLPRLY